MRSHFRGLGWPAVVALLGVVLTAGCGGGGSSGTSPSTGISATASITGNTVTVSAQTDRSDIAMVWAVITGASDQLTLTGSGRNWSGSTQVIAPAGSIVTVQVYARDSVGNLLGPATVRVTMGQFGAQPTVTGQVVRSEDGAPIQAATVTLGGHVGTTNANGRFVITGLTAGVTLEGIVSKSGFEEKRFTVTVGPETVDVGRIALSATQELPPPAPTF